MEQTLDPTFDFPDIPPFPTDVSAAPLLRLSLQKLLDNDSEETSRLWHTCCDVGFFYLDLRDAHGSLDSSPSATNGVNGAHSKSNGDAAKGDVLDGNSFLRDAEALFGTADEFFKLPVEEKAKYDFKDQGSYFGYKGYGDGIMDKAGNRDRTEFYNISKDDIIGLSDHLPAPSCLTLHRPLISSYMRTSHAIVTLILSHLNNHLHLPPNTLTNLHRMHANSGDQVRFLIAPPQPPQDSRASLGAHTDFGSVTLLFNRLGGLQILPPDTDGMGLSDEGKAPFWQYVRPLRGHCVVNLGDAMVKFTRGVLRSNIHRVVNPPGEQAKSVRFSLVYFNRPEDDVLLRALEGSDVIDGMKQPGDDDKEEEVINAKDWVLRRALGRRGVGDFDKSAGTEAVRGMREVSVK